MKDIMPTAPTDQERIAGKQGLEELIVAREHRYLRLRALTLVRLFGKKPSQQENQMVVGPVDVIEGGKRKSFSVVRKTDEESNDSSNSGGIIISEDKGKEGVLTLHFIGNNPPPNLLTKAVSEDMEMASKRLSSIEEVLTNSAHLKNQKSKPSEHSRTRAYTFNEGLDSLPFRP